MGRGRRFSLQRYYPDLVKEHYTPERIEEWKAIHAIDASRQYRDRFLSGDEKAIFHFVKVCPECFREVWPFPDGSTIPCYSENNFFPEKSGRSWVIEQIEKWKNEDTKEARTKLKALFKAYTDSRGAKRKPPEEDQRIYSQIKKAYKKTKNLTDAIWKVVDVNNNPEKGLDPSLQKLLLKHSKDMRRDKKALDTVAIETGIAKRKLTAYVKSGASIFNTYKEIYYEMEKLEKEKKRVFGT